MSVPIWQRILGVIVYMLPWSDAIPFGSHLFITYTYFQWLTIPALPIVILQQILPFGSLLLFFILFLAVVRNPKVSYFLRFNTLQALLIDIGVVLIGYAFQILLKPLSMTLAINSLSSTVLIGILALVMFAIYECCKGKEPDLPGISEAVRMQLY